MGPVQAALKIAATIVTCQRLQADGEITVDFADGPLFGEIVGCVFGAFVLIYIAVKFMRQWKEKGQKKHVKTFTTDEILGK